jgi:hypothetical protein
MASLFTDSEKTEIRSLFEDLHDTFKQDIYVFIEEALQEESDSDYNPLYERRKDQSLGVGQKILTKHTIQARVHYFKKSEDAILDNIGLPSSANVIRLKVDESGLNLLNKSSFIQVDGNKCQLISNPESVGPFVSSGALYYKVYVKVDT